MLKYRKTKHRNLEDVDQTIINIREDKNRAKYRALTVIKWVFFPFYLVGLFFRFVFTTQKVRLTTKTTVIFTLIFGFLIAMYIVFLVSYLKDFLIREGMEAGDFIPTLTLISLGVGAAFLFIGAAAGAIVSNAMLAPIRKMITEIDGINGEDLTQRLKPVDSQDEIMELVQQINRMLDSLEESFERQSNFVSDASHELKTPLSVISGSSELLERWGKNDSAVLDESLAAIRREATYMAKIIDQMLLLARLGRLTMHKQEADISEVVGQIVDSYRLTAAGREFDFWGTKEAYFECDKALLVEAVRAIIDNAIKYSPGGGVITVGVTGGGESVSISVADNGIGIDAEDLPYVFDRFFRCDKTRGREKGSGLGLTICKNIIEMMDGRISVKSMKGEGTEFIIEF
ncbi:MAG: HAMP domain-containing histidine kinase [Firmicutes bacterium]|nr:HAMP domain-containing histidine kinase [Bacillota bacterium]